MAPSSHPLGPPPDGSRGTRADAITDLFEGIDHVGYAVADLDRAIEFHTAVLGWHLVHRERNEDQGVDEAMLQASVAAPDAQPWPAQIQLLAPLSEESSIGKFLARSGPGVQQVAYRVADLAATTRVLAERGVGVVYPEPRRGTAGSLINFLHPKETGGILLELVQHLDADGRAEHERRAASLESPPLPYPQGVIEDGR